MNPAFAASRGGEGETALSWNFSRTRKSDKCPMQLIFSRIESFRTMARLDMRFGGNRQVV
jgi:hypothetical protein